MPASSIISELSRSIDSSAQDDSVPLILPKGITRPPSAASTFSWWSRRGKSRSVTTSRNGSVSIDHSQSSLRKVEQVEQELETEAHKPRSEAKDDMSLLAEKNNYRRSSAEPEVEVDKDARKAREIYDTVQKVQIEPDRKGWARLSDVYHKYDEDRIRDTKEDIDTLLVFAGLFSAVLSAFIIETYPNLQENSGDTNTRVLTQISSQLASLSITNNFVNSTKPSYTPSPFIPPATFVRINTLWSCSLVISLITASFGILVKQWLHEYMAQATQTPLYRLRVRFFRSEGLEKWHVFELAAALPLLLQVALLLFFIGLSEFLRELNPVVGWTTTFLVLVWLIIFSFTTLAPTLSSQCPYKTPILKGPLHYLRPIFQGIWDPCLNHAVRATRFLLYVPEAYSAATSYGLRYLQCSYAHQKLDHLRKRLVIFRQSLQDWSCERFPEEEIVQKIDDSDLDIIVSAEPVFLEEQLKRTISECSDGMELSAIYRYYKAIRGSDKTSPVTNCWRFTLPPEARIGLKGVGETILIHKSRDPRTDRSWPQVLESIIADDKSGPWWNQLPALFIQLIQSSVEWGAVPIFLILYTSAGQQTFNRWNMYQNCRLGKRADDVQYIDNLIATTRLLKDELWPHRLSITPSKHIQELIKTHNLDEDIFALCYTFSMMLLLASPEAIEQRKGDVKVLTSDILAILEQDLPLLHSVTRITDDQLDSSMAALTAIQEQYCSEAVNGDLISKLATLKPLVWEMILGQRMSV
ncbi:hypothetical protein QCA50_019508 [Cerrena zonata]|uniref:DUF6535 domain-containing protein n=1 Tax=Cerrena zonata TaxID=2478898 RepID=A0AAW0FJV4_9APHY